MVNMEVKEAEKAGKAQLCKTFKVILFSKDSVCKAKDTEQKVLSRRMR